MITTIEGILVKRNASSNLQYSPKMMYFPNLQPHLFLIIINTLNLLIFPYFSSRKMNLFIVTSPALLPEAINEGGPISTFVPWRKLTLEPGSPLPFKVLLIAKRYNNNV